MDEITSGVADEVPLVPACPPGGLMGDGDGDVAEGLSGAITTEPTAGAVPAVTHDIAAVNVDVAVVDPVQFETEDAVVVA